MKAGELYDFAKQAYPALTKRLFTQFYNMALEQLSEMIRIDIVDEDYDDDSFKTIPAQAVMIEHLYSDEIENWSVVDGELIFYDDEGEAKTSVDGLHIKWWRRVTDALEDIGVYPKEDSFNLTVTSGTPTLGIDYIDTLIVAQEDIDETGLNPDTIVSEGDICLFDKTAVKFYIYDPENLNVRTEVAETLADGIYEFRLLSDMWEEQDDGFSSEVQLCAVYLALSQAAEFSAQNAEAATFAATRAKEWTSRLRRKYNASIHYKSFTPVHF
jgi:hypothetical protein